MTKLKCWKKEKPRIIDGREIAYWKNKRGSEILLLKYPISENYGVRIAKEKRLLNSEDFNSKPKALAFANKYMKEHDTC